VVPAGRRGAVAYGLMGLAWIVLSGASLAVVYDASVHVPRLEVAKDALLVAVSGAAIFFLIRWRARWTGRSDGATPGEQRYRALFHGHPDAIYLLDLDGRFRDGNQRLAENLQVPCAELIGRRFDRYVAPGELERVRAEFTAALAGGARQYDMTVLRGDGSRFKASITNIPLYENGAVSGVFGIGRDISVQTEARTALALSEQRYRALFQHHPDSVYLLDCDGRFVECNDALTRLLGGVPEVLHGQSYEQFVAPADRQRVRDHFEAARRGETRTYEADGIGPDGGPVTVQVTNVPLYEEGRIAGVFGLAKDITAERAAARLLKASETRFRSIVSAADDAIVVSTAEGLILSANPAAERLFRMPAKDLCGRRRQQFLDNESPGVRAFYRERDERGTARGEIDILPNGGGRVPVEITANLFDDEDGRRCAVVILRDISARKAADARLAQSEERFRTVLDRTGHVVYEYDLGRRSSVWEGACESLFGRSAAELEAMGEPERLDMVHPEDRSRLHAIGARARRDGGAYSAEYRVRHPDGAARHLLERGVVTLERDRIFAVISDVTAEHELNEELRASEARFRHIIRHTGQVVYEIDLDTDRAVWGGACREIMGRDAEQLGRLDFTGRTEPVHPEDREAVRRGLRPGFKDGTFDLRFRWVRPDDGRERYLSARGVYFPEARRLYGVIEDVTDSERLLQILKQRDRELRESAAVRQSILDALPAHVVLLDAAGVVRFANRAWRTFAESNALGVAEAGIGMNYYAACDAAEGDDADDAVAAATGIRAVIAGRRGQFDLEYPCHSPDRERWFRLTATPCRFEGRPGAVVAHMDVTDRVLAEGRHRLMATAFERADQAILVCDRDFLIEDVNEAYVKTIGMGRDEARGQRPQFLDIAQQGKAVRRALAREGRFAGEVMQRRANRETFLSQLSVTTVETESGTVARYIVNFSDISAERELKLELDYLAWHDVLTGLPNRAALEEWFVGSLPTDDGKTEPAVLALFDLDRFKVVNESMGHGLGDELLKEASRRLRRACGERDYVARLGADEFVLILRGPATAEEAEQRIAETVQTLGVPFNREGHTIYPSVSAGVCLAPRDGTRMDDLLRRMEVALDMAKASGRARVQLYLPAMDREVEERGYIEHELRTALRRDEFTLHFQPEVDLRDGRVTGLEALVRWESPVLGLVAPGRFIPVAEETGLIIDLGTSVIRSACRIVAGWQKAGLRTGPVAINLSAMQFLHPDLIPLFRDTMRRYGIGPGVLRVEVTESVAMLDPERTVAALGELRILGVEAALDDFGTGYSSLEYLRRLPVQYVKLDRVFVSGLPADRASASIVASVLDIARDLDLGVIAEGVETEAQRDALIAAGCTEAQGFYYALPMAAERIEGLLSERQFLPVGRAAAD